MGKFEPLSKRISVLFLILLLGFHLLDKCSGYSGLNIYSSLPEFVIEWLKRHVFFEIKHIKENGGVCSSKDGPYCKHSYRMLLREYRDLEELGRFDGIYGNSTEDNYGEGGTSFSEKNNKSQYLHVEYKHVNGRHLLDENGQEERLVMLEHNFFSQRSENLNIDDRAKNIIKANGNDYKILYSYCKLNLKRWFYCLKIVGNSLMINFRIKISKFMSYFRIETLIRLLNKYLIRKRLSRRLDKLGDNYYYIEDYELPNKDFNYEINLEKRNERNIDENFVMLNKGVTNFKVPVNTGVLFDDVFSKFLVSKSIRTSLVSTLTWILDQKSAYIEIWNNWRNERLNRRYIIGTDINYKKNDSSENEYIVSPFTKLKMLKKEVLFHGEFNNNFKIIRKTWNGVSLKLDFNLIRPSVKIIANNFCSNYNIECGWEGIWETYYINELNLRLLSKKGKFYINNQKFVLSDFPITIFNPYLDNLTPEKMVNEYENKYITISGYNGFILMWKSQISISSIINKINKGANMNLGEFSGWINALDLANTIPYSLIDSIYIESDMEGVVVGPFVFNLLNPAYNYIPKSNVILNDISVEVDQTSELSLVINFDSDGEVKESSSSVSITTMYLSKASPLISLYTIQNKGLNLESMVNENTKCIIKRNLAEFTINN